MAGGTESAASLFQWHIVSTYVKSKRPRQRLSNAAAIAILLAAAVITLAVPIFLDKTLSNIDRDTHFRWLHQVAAALAEGTMYPRWMPQANLGMGELAYSAYLLYWYLAGALTVWGFSVWGAVKFLAVLSIFASGLLAYWYARRVSTHGNSLLCGIATIASPLPLFLFTHYSAFPWAFSLSAALLFIIISLSPQRTVGRTFALISIVACLSLLHVLVAFMAIMCIAPAVLLSSQFADWRRRVLDVMASWLAPVALGLGLASIHLIPAVAARGLLNPDTSGNLTYLDWHNSFAFPTVTAYLYGMRWFSVQWIHALILLFATFFASIRAINYRGDQVELRRSVLLLASASAVGLLFASELAYPLYQYISQMRSVQWPYRFLSISAITAPLALAMSLRLRTHSRFTVWTRFVSCTCLVSMFFFAVALQIQATRLGTLNNFGPELLKGEFQQFGNELNSVGPRWREFHMTGGLPGQCQKLSMVCVTGVQTSQFREWRVSSENASQLLLPAFDFPGWETRIDDAPSPHSTDAATGLVSLSVPPGAHKIAMDLVGIPAERTGRLIALLALLLAVPYALILSRAFRARDLNS